MCGFTCPFWKKEKKRKKLTRVSGSDKYREVTQAFCHYPYGVNIYIYMERERNIEYIYIYSIYLYNVYIIYISNIYLYNIEREKYRINM